MAKPKSALAELLEAASKDCDNSGLLGNCPVCVAKDDLAALARALAGEVLAQRSAGQALAEALDGTCCDNPTCFCDEAALARWAKLTETEVRDA